MSVSWLKLLASINFYPLATSPLLAPISPYLLLPLQRGTSCGTDVMRIQCPHGGWCLWGARIKLAPSRNWAKDLLISAILIQVPEIELLVPRGQGDLSRGPQWTMPSPGQSIFLIFLYGCLIPSRCPLSSPRYNHFPLSFSSQSGPAGDQWYCLWGGVWSAAQMLTSLVLSLLQLTLKRDFIHSIL